MRDYFFRDELTGETVTVAQCSNHQLQIALSGDWNLPEDSTASREQIMERVRLEVFIRERGLR